MMKRNYSILAALFALFLFASGVSAEEWYLARRTRLLKRGSAEVGTRMQFSSNRDGIEWDRVLDGVLSVRYAPTERLELYLENPYSYREEKRVIFPRLVKIQTNGPGDLYTQLSYDFLGGSDWRMLLSVDAGIPTAKNSYEDNRRLGSGFYRFTPGVTLIQVIDPASLFLYMGYQTGPAETFGGVGSIEPGDVFRFRLGASLALSPRLRGSIYTAGDIIARTKLNRVRIEHTEGDLIRFGGSLGWDATERVKVEMNSVFGATAEATDAVVTLGITYKIR